MRPSASPPAPPAPEPLGEHTAGGRLTPEYVEAAPPGRHTDGNGLSLVVKPSQRRSWALRYSDRGTRRELGLGGYPAVSLEEARRRAAAIRAQYGAGLTPGARRSGEVPTFAQAAAEFRALHQPQWRNDRHAAEWLDSLRRHAAPLLDMPVDRITRSDVLAVLHPIWHDKNPTARRVRQRIRKVLDYAMTMHDHIASNAADRGIEAALPARAESAAHQRALHYRDVPDALGRIAATSASDAAKLCLRFAVLTAARSGEARGARWAEMSYATTEWQIPAERMKSGRGHRVPLSPQALEVLDAARALDDGSGLVFPSPFKPGRPLSWQALLKLLRTNELDCTVHGFRSSFKTWAVEQSSASWTVSEAALAHSLGNSTEAAYVRTDLFEQRRLLMAAWADFAARR